MIHLKTNKSEGRRLALLVEPSAAGCQCDTDLYAAVYNHGGAVICLFEKGNPLQLEKETIKLTPSEFEREWRGD